MTETDPPATTPAVRARYAKEVNVYINDYIRFADVKSTALTTLLLAMTAGIAKAASPLLDLAKSNTTFLVLVVCALLATLLLLSISLAFCVAALRPSTQQVQDSEEPPVLSSFPDLAKMTPRAAAQAVAELTESEIAGHMSRHNVILSRIARAKYDLTNKGIACLFLALILVSATSVLYVLAEADASRARPPAPVTDNSAQPLEPTK